MVRRPRARRLSKFGSAAFDGIYAGDACGHREVAIARLPVLRRGQLSTKRYPLSTAASHVPAREDRAQPQTLVHYRTLLPRHRHLARRRKVLTMSSAYAMSPMSRADQGLAAVTAGPCPIGI